MKLLSVVLLVSAVPLVAPKSHASEQPNVIVFLADDLGWGDLACFGHERIQTPHLDQFAAEGLKLTQCYSACSVCSPSRSAILTGRTPYRNGVWRWIQEGSKYHLRTSEITIAEILKERGYDTCHTGKWHLNGLFNDRAQPQPNDHGFDHWLATQNNASPNHLNPDNFVRNGVAAGRIEGPSSMICVNEAVEWIGARKNADKPFFLTLWTHEPHEPIESAEEYMKPYADIVDPDIRQHHGNVTQMDAAFGRLMAGIEKLGYRDNTIVFFTSDNGPEGDGTKGRSRGSTGGLRGRKRHTHEGGIRVPGMVRWPGHVTPGTQSDTPVIGSDLFTTICDITRAPLPADRTIDGASILPIFENKPITRTHPLYWRNHLAPEPFRVALREGDWKIVASDKLATFELYNLREDWQESQDLAAKYPEKFNELREKLIAHDAAVLKEGPDWWKTDDVRTKANRNVNLPSDRSKFHLFVLAGQSNMAGRGKVEPQDLKPNPRVLALDRDGEWQVAVDPLHFDKSSAGVGLGKTFAINYAKAHPGVTVGLVPCAAGGSPIKSWEPGERHEQTKSNPYDDALSRTRIAMKTGTVKGVLWHQGESDTTPELSQVYERNLHQLIARMRADFESPILPFVAGQLGQFKERAWDDADRRLDAALQALPSKVAQTAFVNSDGLLHGGDELHFDSKSLRDFGHRYFAAYQTIANAPLKNSSRLDQPTQRNVVYGSAGETSLELDFYEPTVRRTVWPLIIWVHGGAWRAGKKSDVPIVKLREQGFAIASVDYRLSPVAKFPAQIHDIKSAIRFLRANAVRFDVDPNAFVIAGSSAGAHLAVLAAVSSGIPELEGERETAANIPSDVQAIASFYGAGNLQTILAQSTEFGLTVRIPALQLLLGGLPDQKLELARLASPVEHIDSQDPPLWLYHGDQDPQMPIEQSYELASAYKKAGLPVQFEVIHGGKHGGPEFFTDEQLRRLGDELLSSLESVKPID